MRAEVAGVGAPQAEVGRFLSIKAEKTNERGAPFACLKKKVKRLLGCAVQQRVPESEWVDEGLNGLEGKLGMCVYTGMAVCVRAHTCVCVSLNLV